MLRFRSPKGAKHFSIILLVLFPSLSLGGWIDREGNQLPDTNYRKSIGSFGAQLILTSKVEEAFKNWEQPSDPVDIDTSETIKRNEFVSALIVFSGCAENESKHCNLTVKFIVLQPDGKVYANIPTQEVWMNKPSPGRALQMSVGYIKLRVEDHEPLGLYQIIAEVHDLNSNKKLSLSSEIEVVE